jgi:spermidine/putrescine transport system ATP-binding protein
MPPAVPEVRLDRIEKRYGDVVAVDGVTLEILPGEFFSLLGPSGCGKTTTLRMIGGFEIPTGGRILLRDRDVTREPPDKRAVNMVFQHYALFPHLTVGDNIAFGPKRSGLPRDETRRRVAEALELVRLEGYEKRKPHQLSGGQQQRVALARALANRPNVLLLDEPLGALDLKLRRQLQVELKRIQAEVGITFVYVTHDQEEALTMSDRIAVMNAGHVEQLGTPEDLYERPATRFVADFMGTTNLLRGTVGADGCVRLETGEIVAAGAGGHAAGSIVDVSIRPESARIVPAGPSGTAPAAWSSPATALGGLAGCVEQAAYLGTSFAYLVRTTDGLGLTVLVAKEETRIPVGREVVVSWSPEVALVLGSGPVPAMEEAQP